MKRTLAVGLLVLLSAVACSASVVLNVTETFGSGAVFTGAVTFLDDYSNVSAVDGWLTGGSYGNDHIGWIWDPSENNASSFGPQYGMNWLMDETGYYQSWITFTWDFSNAPYLVLSSPGGVLGEFGGNNIDYHDPLVSGTIGGGSIPEPATSALIAGGLLAIAAFLRRRQKRP